jgi:hypothetical protein
MDSLGNCTPIELHLSKSGIISRPPPEADANGVFFCRWGCGSFFPKKKNEYRHQSYGRGYCSVSPHCLARAMIEGGGRKGKGRKKNQVKTDGRKKRRSLSRVVEEDEDEDDDIDEDVTITDEDDVFDDGEDDAKVVGKRGEGCSCLTLTYRGFVSMCVKCISQSPLFLC